MRALLHKLFSISVGIAVGAMLFMPFIGMYPSLVHADEDRALLEQQLAELEDQIVKHEATIAGLKTQGKSLQSEISRLNAQVDKINLQIKAVNLQISKLDSEINEKEYQIKDTEKKIDFNKDALTQALQKVYVTEQSGLMEVLLENPKLSDFFGDVNNLLNVQNSLVVTIDKITDLKTNLTDQKETLSLQREDAAALKRYQDAQRMQAQNVKKEKATLLSVTKGKEVEFQKVLQETKKTAAEIRGRIFKLLGGGQLTFEEAYEFAKLAEGTTGIRAALVLAVLDQESALGKNVGKCNYKTAMHPTRDIPIFLTLVAELGLNPDQMMVSCAISAHGAYGGAMGPAQFIPSTWNLYKSSIAAVTGNNPPSPWRNADAFIATSLYLKDSYSSASCVKYGNDYSHILPKQMLQERCAAAKYYAGGRWFTYRFIYGDPVLERANRFEQDIAILTG
ncbi:MAG: lytic murein transglycosylase [Patescibacteria group bacterium]